MGTLPDLKSCWRDRTSSFVSRQWDDALTRLKAFVER
jgi:hypothetical protein